MQQVELAAAQHLLKTYTSPCFSVNIFYNYDVTQTRYDMNGRFQIQGGKNRILPKDMNANRFFWDSHWLEIWSNHFCPSMGPNGGSVATAQAADPLPPSAMCSEDR